MKDLPTSHYLLPYERRRAGQRLDGQKAHPTAPAVVRLQQNYGPEGNILLAAAGANRIYAFPVIVVSGILLVATGGSGAIGLVGYLIGAAGIAMGLVAMVRGIQAGRAGKIFRAGRLFVRP